MNGDPSVPKVAASSFKSVPDYAGETIEEESPDEKRERLARTARELDRRSTADRGQQAQRRAQGERAIERSRRWGGMASLLYVIGAIHTGANLHGGNPTIFGVPSEPQPLLGWVIGLSWIVAAPIIFNLVAALLTAVQGIFLSQTSWRDG